MMKLLTLSFLTALFLLTNACRSPQAKQAQLSESEREARVQQLSKFIRPDMPLADANELFGWEASFDQGSWYWTDSRRFIVNTGSEYRIVHCLDFYRYVSYHKLIDQEGVFEKEIPKYNENGDPINFWQEPAE